MTYYIEQKPRIIFSQSQQAKDGNGWIIFYFEGVCLHSSFEDAKQCVRNYYNVDMLAAAEPLTTGIQ